MLKRLNPSQTVVVDLSDRVSITTAIPKCNHAALRAGFAGYPPNPRWNVKKFSAWKTGYHWREALASGEMVIRTTDSMLVPAREALIPVQQTSAVERPQKVKLSSKIKRIFRYYYAIYYLRRKSHYIP